MVGFHLNEETRGLSESDEIGDATGGKLPAVIITQKAGRAEETIILTQPPFDLQIMARQCSTDTRQRSTWRSDPTRTTAPTFSSSSSSSPWGFTVVTLWVVVMSLVMSPTEGGSTWKRKEFRMAWLAPKEMHRGFSAASSVNALKVSLRAAELSHILGHSVR